MIVVSDTSPIIALATVGRLSLLRELYGEVLIPEMVRWEIAEAGAGEPGAREVEESDWIIPCAASDRRLVEGLSRVLDRGEAEAIALAVERNSDLLLVDERRARRNALRLGVRVIGVLGILIEAKNTGLVREIRSIIDNLVSEAGFRVAPRIVDQVLRIVGE